MQIFLVAWIVIFAYITHHSVIVFYYDRRSHKGLREFSRGGSRAPHGLNDVPIQAGRQGLRQLHLRVRTADWYVGKNGRS